MDRTPKILTIIGLVFEGFSVVVLGIFALLFRNYQELPFMDEAMAELTGSELEDFIWIMDFAINLMTVMFVIIGVFFIINIFLFSKLMSGKYTEEVAKKVYLYQAIWGGFNLLSNQITGILYLISGVSGFNGYKEMTKKDIREGI
jgi:hypothetical protein